MLSIFEQGITAPLFGGAFARADGIVVAAHELVRAVDDGGAGLPVTFGFDATYDLRYSDWFPATFGWENFGPSADAKIAVGSRQPPHLRGAGPGGSNALRGDGEDDTLVVKSISSTREVRLKLRSRSVDAASGQVVFRWGTAWVVTTATGYAVAGPDATPGPGAPKSFDVWQDVVITLNAAGDTATLSVDGTDATASIAPASLSGRLELFGDETEGNAWAGDIALAFGFSTPLAGAEATAWIDYASGPRFTNYAPPADLDDEVVVEDPSTYTNFYLLSVPNKTDSIAAANQIAAMLGGPADAGTFSPLRGYASSDGDAFATAMTQLTDAQAAQIEAVGTLEALIPGDGAYTYDRSEANSGVARDADGQAKGGYTRLAHLLGRAGETFERTLAEGRSLLALDVASDPLAAIPAYANFDPATLAGALSDGDAVQTWEDLSGTGDATKATTAPIFRDGSGPEGLPFVEMIGADYLALPPRIAGSSTPHGTEHEIWIIVTPTATSGHNYIYGPTITGGGIAVVNGMFAIYNPNFNQRLNYVQAVAGNRYLIRLRYIDAGNGNYTLNVDSSDGSTNGAGGQAWNLHQPHMIGRKRQGSFENGGQFKGFRFLHLLGRVTGQTEADVMQYISDRYGVSTPLRYQ